MARTLKYALERGGPKRLAIRKRWFWRKTELSLDGQSLGPPIPDMAALRAGREYPMPDGRRLLVGFQKQLGSAGLALSVNGRPVPGAINDPRTTIRYAGKLLFYLAGLNLFIAGLVLSLTDRLNELAAVVGGFGLVMLALGVGVFHFRSRVALVIAIVLEIADGIANLALVPSGSPPIGPIIFRTLIVLALIRAYKAVADARRLEVDEQLDKAFD